MLIISDKIHRNMWVKGKRRDVLEYSCVEDRTGEIHSFGLISLDKRWMRPAIKEFGCSWKNLNQHGNDVFYYVDYTKSGEFKSRYIQGNIIVQVNKAITAILEQDLLGYESETTIK